MRPELEAVLDRARTLGFLGPGSIRVHYQHGQRFLPPLEGLVGRVADLGSGGGLPGLVIAEARPDLSLVLIDSNVRRVAHLRWAVGLLELSARVEVVLGRAEELSDQLPSDFVAVVARSFGPRSAVCECGAPLLAHGGRLLISEPPERRQWPPEALVPLGLGVDPAWSDTPIAVLTKLGTTQDQFPRPWREQQKRPLF